MKKRMEGDCSRVPELLCKFSFLISLHLQSKSSEWVSAFGHQLKWLLVMSTVGSKILLPKTEEGTSVAVGAVSIQPLNCPVEICGSVCVRALSLSKNILLMCLGQGNNRQHQWMLFHFDFFLKCMSSSGWFISCCYKKYVGKLTAVGSGCSFCVVARDSALNIPILCT